MSKPNPTDFIELKVEDDGDVILIKRQEPGDDGPAIAIDFPPTKNLCYGITIEKNCFHNNELKSLEAELLSYGCPKKASQKAILEASFGAYNEEVTVK